MRLIEIKALPNGAHNNQTLFGTMIPPSGWAVIPDTMETPNFPFGDIEVLNIDGLLTVTKWIPGTIPEIKEDIIEPTPSINDRLTALEDSVSTLEQENAELLFYTLTGEELASK